MDELLKILHFLNLEYILSVNLLSYLIIKKMFPFVKSFVKILITILIGAILSYVYYKFKLIDKPSIIPSFAVAVAMYDYVLKYILSLFKNLSYKK